MDRLLSHLDSSKELLIRRVSEVINLNTLAPQFSSAMIECSIKSLDGIEDLSSIDRNKKGQPDFGFENLSHSLKAIKAAEKSSIQLTTSSVAYLPQDRLSIDLDKSLVYLLEHLEQERILLIRYNSKKIDLCTLNLKVLSSELRDSEVSYVRKNLAMAFSRKQHSSNKAEQIAIQHPGTSNDNAFNRGFWIKGKSEALITRLSYRVDELATLWNRR